jgi:hypothetical protein
MSLAARRFARGVVVDILETQAAVHDVTVDEDLMNSAWIIFQAYKTLLLSLAPQEYASVERHLERAFGVKKTHRLESLAVQCLLSLLTQRKRAASTTSSNGSWHERTT